MTGDIKGAYDSVIKDVDAIAALVTKRKISVEVQNEMELRGAIIEVQVTKAQLKNEAESLSKEV
jgi:hypothetical protein